MTQQLVAGSVALLVSILIAMTGAPVLAQSHDDICDAYRETYAREQDKINRMKNEPYKTNKQKRLDEKRARLERECANRGEQIRRDEPDPGRVASLPGYLRIAKDKEHARHLARQAYETRLSFIEMQRQDAFNAYRVNMSRCAGSDTCISNAVAGAVRRQAQLDQEAQDAARVLSRDLRQIQDTVQLPDRAQ